MFLHISFGFLGRVSLRVDGYHSSHVMSSDCILYAHGAIILDRLKAKISLISILLFPSLFLLPFIANPPSTFPFIVPLFKANYSLLTFQHEFLSQHICYVSVIKFSSDHIYLSNIIILLTFSDESSYFLSRGRHG